MPKYVSTERIKQSIERVKLSRARPALLDFLILKRALKISGLGPVPLSMTDRGLRTAINEYMSCDLETPPGSIENSRCLVNFFAFGTSKFLRATKHYSNGTSDTLKGRIFKDIVHIEGRKPVVASLALGHEAYLAGRLLVAKESIPLPRIDDVALWFFRTHDVEPLVLKLSPYETITEIISRFQKKNGLDEEEIGALFDTEIPVDEYADYSWLQDAVAEPSEYLPTASEPPVPTRTRTPFSTSSRTTASGGGTSATEGCSFNLVVSLAAKGFVVLSGPSGTGKSRGALQLATTLQNVTGVDDLYALIPVGADWTDSRYLLGYKNPFGASRDRGDGTTTNESYEITDTLRLILRSVHEDRIDVPHFLILDEMNLSHVERYFSAFLSLMEANRSVSGGSIPLLNASTVALISDVLKNTEPESVESEAAQSLVEAGDGLTLSDNFSVVGTINVDETTYMFSPKVLDRAHVIEILSVSPGAYITGTEISEHLISGEMAVKALVVGDPDPRDRTLKPSEGFIDLAHELGFDPDMALEIVGRTTILLDGAYKLLEPVGFAFGYRLVNEVFRYLQEWLHASSLQTGTGAPTIPWQEALDNVFLQKVLPKIHGNRRHLGESLTALIAFLQGYDSAGTPPAKYRLGSDAEVMISATEKFEAGIEGQMLKSIKKLTRMNRRLLATNYTTFVE